MGLRGLPGKVGPPGIQGERGLTGLQGKQGESGIQGIQGTQIDDLYPNGINLLVTGTLCESRQKMARQNRNLSHFFYSNEFLQFIRRLAWSCWITR